MNFRLVPSFEQNQQICIVAYKVILSIVSLRFTEIEAIDVSSLQSTLLSHPAYRMSSKIKMKFRSALLGEMTSLLLENVK